MRNPKQVIADFGLKMKRGIAGGRNRNRGGRLCHTTSLAILRQIGDYYFLVPIRKKTWIGDSIYMINEIGAYIWSVLDTVRSIEEIEKLIMEYSERPKLEDIGGDIDEFLAQLQMVGLIDNKQIERLKRQAK